MKHCCYSNNVAAFLSENKAEWIEKMKTAFSAVVEMPLGESQVRAWKDCFDVLKEQLPPIADTNM